jgi:hypothetical protein
MQATEKGSANETQYFVCLVDLRGLHPAIHFVGRVIGSDLHDLHSAFLPL